MSALGEPPVQPGSLHQQPSALQAGKDGQDATRGPMGPPRRGHRLHWGRSATHLQSLGPGLTEDRQPPGYEAEDVLPGKGEAADRKAQEQETGWREEQSAHA